MSVLEFITVVLMIKVLFLNFTTSAGYFKTKLGESVYMDDRGVKEAQKNFNHLCFVKSKKRSDVLPVYNIDREIVVDFMALA